MFRVVGKHSCRWKSAIVSFSEGIIPDLGWYIHIFVKCSNSHSLLLHFPLVVDVTLIYNTGPLRYSLLELNLIICHCLESSSGIFPKSWVWFPWIIHHQIVCGGGFDVTKLARSTWLLIFLINSTCFLKIGLHLLFGYELAHSLSNVVSNLRLVLLFVVSTIFDIILADKVLLYLLFVIRPVRKILIKMIQSSLLLALFEL